MDATHAHGHAEDHGSKAPPMVLMATEHYAGYRWVQAPVSALALWLIASPLTLGTESRAIALSDTISGVVALGLSIVALGRRRGLASWLIGVEWSACGSCSRRCSSGRRTPLPMRTTRWWVRC